MNDRLLSLTSSPQWLAIALVATLAVGLPFLAYQVRRLFRIARADMRQIDAMPWQEFEEALELMFLRLGYQAQRTPRKDWGADLIITLHGIKTAVQAKQRRNERVGVSAVREVVASKEKYRCSGAMVISNSAFTSEALELARTNRVVMVNRDRLAAMLVESHARRKGAPSAETLQSDSAPCQECGKAVTPGVRDYCVANGERFGGRILCMQHQRTHAIR